ncbi:MAG: hybrid sensor histidine kinase/response regulator [Gammaproteobacteria bacterium]|nr:MAG: hybrid sensor histidine kinase/response regulator [Gammaproteobacteria bacterium]
MQELFREEVAEHGQALTEGLLSLEQEGGGQALRALMRAAHSIKGAARLIGLEDAVALAHALEDCFVALERRGRRPAPEEVDLLLGAVDRLLARAREGAPLPPGELEALTGALRALGEGAPLPAPGPGAGEASQAPAPRGAPGRGEEEGGKAPGAPARAAVLRISAERFDRLMGLAGQASIEARWLRPYVEGMIRLKQRTAALVSALDRLRDLAEQERGVSEELKGLLRQTQGRVIEARKVFAQQIAELESYDRRVGSLSSRLRQEIVQTRMRPFGDGVRGLPRMVRDVARRLGKEVQLRVEGEGTLVDGEILERLETPLNHLLRNAVDHGIEPPEERERAGKPRAGTLRLCAFHQAGMLAVVVEDDGRGIDLEGLRRKVVERGLVRPELAAELDPQELMEFIFLPAFSTRDEVTEISGRGVGLDVVRDVIQGMRGMVRAYSRPGRGTRFQLQLPLTLSVIPALLVEAAGEPLALPLVRVQRVLHVERERLREAQGHHYLTVDGQHVGLVPLARVLGLEEEARPGQGPVPVLVVGEHKGAVGLVVDRFLGERDLVVHVLPEALGKVRDVSAAALLEDGSPLLVLEVDDLLRSVERLLGHGRLGPAVPAPAGGRAAKRILVVDDSPTVREVERQLLEAHGYEVEQAVDGLDGWNLLREPPGGRPFDLVITDVDMPRMDGIELVRMVRADPELYRLPVMIVSYKDREEDRYRGLQAGADYYLSKGAFEDARLQEAVADLIGAAVPEAAPGAMPPAVSPAVSPAGPEAVPGRGRGPLAEPGAPGGAPAGRPVPGAEA